MNYEIHAHFCKVYIWEKTLPLGEKGLYKVSPVGLPHTELAGGLTHHPPPTTGKSSRAVPPRLSLRNWAMDTSFFTFLVLPFHHTNFPSTITCHNMLIASKIQLPVFPASHSLVCWCSPWISMQRSDPKAGGCCCPGSTKPCQLLLSPASQGCWAWMGSHNCLAVAQPLLLWVHLKRCSSGSHLLSFCQPLVWLLFTGTPASSL